MEFKELKVGDKVDIVAIKGSPYKRDYRKERESTEVISVKGVRVIQVQVRYRKMWYKENEFGKWINVTGGELSELHE